MDIKKVKMVEVSPRDGLQNESMMIPTEIKVEFINRLSDTGLSVIEATSFVSPKWIPQLADHSEVYQHIKKNPHVSYPVLVFNLRGLENAIHAGVKEIAVFTTPSEEFSRRNANCSVSESVQRIEDIATIALKNKMRMRAYISCVLGCPFEGEIAPLAVKNLASKLIALGIYEVSLGDTIGVGTPGKADHLLKIVLENIPREKIAVHFHDTYGQALANIYVALERGIHVIDSSVAGLGGCPYANGATGNVATEDVLYMLNGLGIQTGVDLNKLIEVGRFISDYLKRENRSKVSIAQLIR
jgi:hydroxymethylglutaryl-CoA lyase